MPLERVIDLHSHTIFSDGELCPAELAQRARVRGYRVLGISDHADQSNINAAVMGALRASLTLSRAYAGFHVLAGVELTHVPPSQLPGLIAEARELGAMYVVVHGETPVEPVEPGTNEAAVEGGADILAHPGFISEETARLAAGRGVLLEISARGGHSLTNGHVASIARRHKARLIINSDAHAPGDILTPELQRRVALGSGMGEDEFREAMKNAHDLAERLVKRHLEQQA